MAKGWTTERRARQAELIQAWRPWERSTGPRTDEGKARTARNGFKGGHWRELRELTKAMNQLLREQRNGLQDVTPSRQQSCAFQRSWTPVSA